MSSRAWQHPWLRIERLIRSIGYMRWDKATRPIAKEVLNTRIDSSAFKVYSRMFAPHTSGVPEDPATGSASGPLGAYLVERGLVPPAATVEIVSEQGTRMGRPSFLRIRVGVSGGASTTSKWAAAWSR